MRTFAQKPKACLQTTSAKSTISGRDHFGQSPEVRSILHLQHTIENQAMQRMLQADTEQPEVGLTGYASPHFGHDFSRIPLHPPAAEAVQTKLAINKPGDSHEQEADRMAEQVMSTPGPQRQRAYACGGELPRCHTEQPGREQESLQTKHVQVSDTVQFAAPLTVHEVLRSTGQTFDSTTRSFMETRFGYDFSRVRVHLGGAAEKSARDVNANAYTVGQNMVFGAGQFAPGTHEGRRLIAHELTHVLQQRHVAPFIQREPRGNKSDAPPKQEELTPYKSTDPVLELKLLFKPEEVGEVWELTVQGDFTTPEGVGRLIWPTRDNMPPGVSITPKFITKVEGRRTDIGSKAPTVYMQQATFELSGVALYTLQTMDPSIAKMFVDLGLIEDSKTVQAARAEFRARHNDLGDQVLDNIDLALKRVTRNNPGLLEAFYRFYSSDWKLTDDIESSSGNAGNTDQGLKNPRGYTDINAGVLHLMKLPKLATELPLSLLGATLIHEYAHTSHARDYLKGPGEGKAYGIENFFNERLGDKKREDVTTDLGPRMGDKKAFDTSYFVMKQLYEVIDGRPSKLFSLKGVSAQRAREMSVEFISNNKEEFSEPLKSFIIKELGQPAYNSLPSKERN